jgi:hypothetical protein
MDDLKKLQREWRARLKDTGFRDIETDEPDGPLRSWSSDFINQFDPLTFHQRSEYFRFANQFLHEHEFENEKDRYLWALHASGASLREIRRRTGLTKDAAHRAIVRIRKILKKNYIF